MLGSIRQATQSLLFRFLLIILIVSFVLWGINDFIVSDNRGAVATIEGEPVAAQEFIDVYNRQLNQYRAMMGEAFSPQLLQQLGMPKQVLTQLVNQKLLELHARNQGIRVSKRVVAEATREIPAFQNEDGVFDPQQFRAALSRVNLSERRYTREMARNIASDWIVGALSQSVRIPDVLLTALYRHQGETRDATVMHLPAPSIDDINAPEEAELLTYYDAQSANFAVPEFRRFAFTYFSSDEISERITISEEAIRRYYEDNQEYFSQPERREVEQLRFDDEETAAAAYKRLKQHSFEEVAGEYGMEAEAMGALARSEFPEEVAEMLFSQAVAIPTEPRETPFGWHIFRVTKILGGHAASLEESRAEITERLREDELLPAMQTLSDNIQDAIAAGDSLQEIATRFSLSLHTVENTDQEGNNSNGKNIEVAGVDGTLLGAATRTAFSAAEGSAPELVLLDDDSRVEDELYYVVQLEHITPSRTRALDEVRGAVLDAWRAEQRTILAREQADTVTTLLESGSAPKTLKTKYPSLTWKKHRRITREGRKQEDMETPHASNDNPDALFLPMIADALFTLEAPGKITQPYPFKDAGYRIVQLDAIYPVTGVPDDKKRNALTKIINTDIQHETLMQYIAHLRRHYNITLNEPLLLEITGRTQEAAEEAGK